MARPKKQTIEYFPHFVSSGKTLFIIENEFGNDGYSFWFKLLEILGSTEGHVYDVINPSELRFLLAKTRVSEEVAFKILNILSELGAIDSELWDKKIIWSQNLVDNVADVYAKRKCSKPIKPSLCTQKTHSTEVIEEFTEQKTQLNGVNGGINPQSKVKESKGKESKENNNNISLLLLLYEQLNFGSINPVTIADIELLEKDYTSSWVEEAFKEANDQGIRNLKYVKGILKNWKTKGFKAEKPRAVQEPKTSGFNNFKPREYDYEDLEKKLLGWDEYE